MRYRAKGNSRRNTGPCWQVWRRPSQFQSVRCTRRHPSELVRSCFGWWNLLTVISARHCPTCSVQLGARAPPSGGVCTDWNVKNRAFAGFFLPIKCDFTDVFGTEHAAIQVAKVVCSRFADRTELGWHHKDTIRNFQRDQQELFRWNFALFSSIVWRSGGHLCR